MQKHIAEETVHKSIDGSGSSSAGSMERSKALILTTTCTKIIEGDMTMGNHEKGSCIYDMIDIMKLERRIRNLENINSGKVPIFRTK